MSLRPNQKMVHTPLTKLPSLCLKYLYGQKSDQISKGNNFVAFEGMCWKHEEVVIVKSMLRTETEMSPPCGRRTDHEPHLIKQLCF